MAEKSNGAGAPIGYMLPPAPGEFFMPAAPGEPAHGWEAPPVEDPMEHQAQVSSGSVPDVESYVGGGIFPASTIGPADNEAPKDSVFSEPSRGASHYGPVMPDVPLQAPMAGPPPGGGMSMYRQDLPLMMPMGDIPQERAHMLGMIMLGTAAGSLVGLKYGGLYGALAGSLVAGSALNAYRAFKYWQEGTPESDKEAQTSGIYAVLTAAAAAGVWYKLVPESARMTPNVSDDDDDEEDWEPSKSYLIGKQMSEHEARGDYSSAEYKHLQKKYGEAQRAEDLERARKREARREARKKRKALPNADTKTCKIRPVGP